MKKTIFVLFLLLRISIIFSQNANLIPNNSFEIGQEGKTPGGWLYYSGDTDHSCRFDDDIFLWRIAKLNHNCICNGVLAGCPSPDWLDKNANLPDDWSYFHYSNGNNTNTPSNRIVRIGSTEGGYHEGIRVGLIGDNGGTYNLKSNKTYILRAKLASLDPGTSSLRIHLAKYGSHWNANSSGNVKQSDIGYIEMSSSIYEEDKFYSFQITLLPIDSDKDDVMSNIILICQTGDLLIDDVELYERSCDQDLYIENTAYTFNKETPYEAQNIIAGYEVANPPIGSGNIIVKSGADVTYKGAQSVQLKPGFSVEPGGKFLAYIAPCGRTCPHFPNVDAGTDVTICNNNPYLLGMPFYNHFQYSWTANPPSATTYLSSTTVSNPVFTPPSNGCGIAKYTLNVSCDNESKTDNVTISYNTTQLSNNYVNATITSNPDDCYLALNLEVSDCAEKVDIEVWDWSQNTKFYSYELKSVVDFNCCNFNWIMPNMLTKCNNYKVIVSAKTICNSQIPTVILDWIRNSVITINAPNVFTPNGDGQNDEFCFSVTGAETYTIYIQNPGTGVVLHQSGIICGPEICVWDGDTYQYGTFYYVASFNNDCQNEVSISGTVNIIGGKNCVITDTTASLYGNENLTATNTIIIHPNPAYSILYIDGLTYPILVSILDLSGKQLFSKHINNHQIDIRNLVQGLYFLELNIAEGKVVKMFVKK